MSGDWKPNMERAVLQVLHQHGVPNAAELAEKCAENLKPIINGVRSEQMDATLSRLKKLAREYLYDVPEGGL